jgi:hypothetical protein
MPRLRALRSALRRCALPHPRSVFPTPLCALPALRTMTHTKLWTIPPRSPQI